MTASMSLSALFRNLISSRVNPAAMTWVDDKSKQIAAGDQKSLYLSFGLVPRKVGKIDLILTESERHSIESLRPGWVPVGWSVDQLVRTYFAQIFPSTEPTSYCQTLDRMFSTGEVGELVALYQALPVLPNPKTHVLRAAEGIRNNIKAVFCAVAHNNPFPSEEFSEDQWNQMVLKCLFIGLSIRPVIGIDERANQKLADMLVDFAHERRAAHRPVPAELWRCVGPFANDRSLADLGIALKSGSPAERQAAALSLSLCPHLKAKAVLAEYPDFAKSIGAGEFSWRTVAAAEQNN